MPLSAPFMTRSMNRPGLASSKLQTAHRKSPARVKGGAHLRHAPAGGTGRGIASHCARQFGAGASELRAKISTCWRGPNLIWIKL